MNHMITSNINKVTIKLDPLNFYSDTSFEELIHKCKKIPLWALELEIDNTTLIEAIRRKAPVTPRMVKYVTLEPNGLLRFKDSKTNNGEPLYPYIMCVTPDLQEVVYRYPRDIIVSSKNNKVKSYVLME